MANLIKNALIKQLSKFLKNVSANQINISTFKGEGEMKNIQLDENVLMELLELPTWLKITNAKCNKATFKVQWTKLKSNPIIIGLDKIELDMEITEDLREPTSKDSKLFDKDLNGPYTFIDKCIDAIQLNIDSITITIKSEKFNANLNMSNIYVYSCTPQWKVTNDIRNTRLKDLEKEEIILYKEISWEICRFEAFILESSSDPANHQQQASIKLIMNPSKIQIALKKKLTDKTLICSTFRILLNEIYWMANDTQLKSAIGTYNTISKLMKKAAVQQRKQVAERQISSQNATNKPKPTTQSPNPQTTTTSDDSKVFCQYDIKETSLHLQISCLNIHLYADDNYSNNNLIDGGALQVLFKSLCIDHYPYHKSGYSTKHWNNYNHIFMQREDWSKELINEFISNLQAILNKSNIEQLNQIKLRNSSNLLEATTIVSLQDLCVYKVTTNMSNKSASSVQKSKRFKEDSAPKPAEAIPTFNELLETKKFFIEQQTYDKRPFFGSNFTEFNLPGDTLFMQFFFSDFYFPEDCNYPVPCSQIYSHLSPMIVNIDYLTLLWMNTLILSLYHEMLIVDQSKKDTRKTEILKSVKNKSDHVKNKMASEKANNSTVQSRFNLHCDTHLEFLMPKIVLSIFSPKSKRKSTSISSQLTGIEIGLSSVCLTNKKIKSNECEYGQICSNAYDSVKNMCSKQSLFKENPKKYFHSFETLDSNFNHLAPCFNEILKNENLSFIRHDLSYNSDLTKLVNTVGVAPNSKLGLFLKSLNRSALNKNANKDIWNIDFKSLWLDCNSNDPNGKRSLIKNASFNFWVVNVHDFYKFEELSVNDETTILKPKQSNSYDSLKNQNLDLIYERLSKIIPIENSPKNQSNSGRKPRSNSLSTTKLVLKQQQASHYLCQQVYSKVNVISQIENIKISCNHEQLVFILRFLETFDLFSEQLEVDSEQCLKYNKAINGSIKNVTKDKNNNMKNKMFDLNINDIPNDEQEPDLSANLNFSMIINNLELELEINNYSLDKFEPNDLLNEKIEPANESILTESNIPIPTTPSGSLFDTTSMNVSIKDPMKSPSIKKEDFEAIAKQIDQEFMNSYLKFIYGLSMDNPNLKLSFMSLPSEEQTPVQKGFDLLGLDVPNKVRNGSFSNLSASNMSMSFSSVSSTVTSSTQALSSKTQSISNKTVSFFNKPLSNLNNVIKTVKNQAELLENEFMDDAESFTHMLGMDQDSDTASLISFSNTDYSVSNSAQTNAKLEKQESSYSLKSSSSASSLNKPSIAAHFQSNSSLHLETIPDNKNHSENKNHFLIDNNSVELVNTSAQTNQQTIKVKITLGNLKTYTQIESNSDIYSLVQVDEVKINNNKGEFKAKVLKNESKSDGDAESDDYKIAIRFRKRKEDADFKAGLVDILIEDFKVEIDVPTMNGLIDFIDDDGDESEEIKPTIPANIKLKNSQFILNKTRKNTLDKFKNSITINDLKVYKSPLNKITITELPKSQSKIILRSSNKTQKRVKSVNKEVVYAECDAKSAERDFLDKVDPYKSEQIASLVNLLRKSKEENSKLQIKLENEVYKAKHLAEEQNEKQKPSFDQYKLERKQFESLLKTYENENEELKARLKKSDEKLTLLNIDRECIIKKLNEQLKTNKR